MLRDSLRLGSHSCALPWWRPRQALRRSPVRTAQSWIGVALLLGAACAVFLWEPWHGPIMLSLSSSHGIDTGDLPALRARARARGRPWPGSGNGPPARVEVVGESLGGLASAVVLGALLLAGVVDDPSAQRAAVARRRRDVRWQHRARRRAAGRSRWISWSHVALTYDGATLRLYVNGTQVSSRATTGAILKTTDPCGSVATSPYGEYFQGLIDEVRVYDRALSPAEVRAEMSTPIAERRATSPAAGLVGAYAFDRDSGTVAADASGNGNAGEVSGATWTTRGRFGRALRSKAPRRWCGCLRRRR